MIIKNSITIFFCLVGFYSFAQLNLPEDEQQASKAQSNLFDRAYELNGSDVSLSNLASYMDVVGRYDSLNDLSSDEILKRYYHIMDAIDGKGDGDDLDKIRGITTNLLAKILGENFDCEFIKGEMVPQLKSNPNVAKRIIMLSLSQGCTGEDFFAEAAKILIEESPDYGLIRLVASKEAEKENYDLALDYYDKALNATDDEEKKAKVTVDIARLYLMKNDYVKSRDLAEKALTLNPDLDKAYKLIGDLYFNSFEKCRQNVDKVNDRAVFWVAYDMYQKAGDQESMTNARAQFPSIGEIFERDYKEGDKFTVNCWINRSTEIRRRPE